MAADDVELVVQMSPDDKKAIEERAAKLGMNTSEYIRTLFSEFAELLDPRNEVEAMCDAIIDRYPTILAELDETDEKIQKLSDTLNTINSTRNPVN